MVAGGRGHCIFIDPQEIEEESKILNIAHTQCVAKLNCDAQSQIILNMFSYTGVPEPIFQVGLSILFR